MLIVSDGTEQALRRTSADDFVERMINWLCAQPELALARTVVTREWAHQQISTANAYGIDSEDACARFARLRLLHDDDWFAAGRAAEALNSKRPGNLKIFQLECASENIQDDVVEEREAHA